MSRPQETDRQVCVQSRRPCPQTLGGLLYSLLKKKQTKKETDLNEERKKREILDYFGGLVLDCITTVSGVQSVIAECSLYICVHFILPEKKTAE